ncbi:hypothetical protein KEM52_004915, partial [Ascosphaera acerosa]
GERTPKKARRRTDLPDFTVQLEYGYREDGKEERVTIDREIRALSHKDVINDTWPNREQILVPVFRTKPKDPAAWTEQQVKAVLAAAGGVIAKSSCLSCRKGNPFTVCIRIEGVSNVCAGCLFHNATGRCSWLRPRPKARKRTKAPNADDFADHLWATANQRWVRVTEWCFSLKPHEWEEAIEECKRALAVCEAGAVVYRKQRRIDN